jgi:hypothetical protein
LGQVQGGIFRIGGNIDKPMGLIEFFVIQAPVFWTKDQGGGIGF